MQVENLELVRIRAYWIRYAMLPKNEWKRQKAEDERMSVTHGRKLPPFPPFLVIKVNKNSVTSAFSILSDHRKHRQKWIRAESLEF